MASIDFEIKPDGINEIISDSGKSRSFIALKEVRWGDTGDFKLDLRRWYAERKDEGEVLTPGKGVTIGDIGGHKLAETLVSNGYGNTIQILKGIENREDTPIEILNALEEYRNKFNKEEVFDPDGLFGSGEVGK